MSPVMLRLAKIWWLWHCRNSIRYRGVSSIEVYERGIWLARGYAVSLTFDRVHVDVR